MSRLPTIATHSTHNYSSDEVKTNSLFFQELQPVPEVINAELLPSGDISRSQSRSSFNFGGSSPKRSNMRKSLLREAAYDNSLSELQNTPFPTIHPEDTMKNRISTLEATANTQTQQFNTLTGQTFRNMGSHVNNVEFALRDLIHEVQTSYENKLNAMKKEYDHR
jgi:hypothetical protein